MSNLIVAESAVKRCAKCGTAKPAYSFSKDSARKDGLRLHCKDCVSVQSAAYSALHKAEKAVYAELHKAEQAAYASAYRAAHREEKAAYRKAHSQESAAKASAWRRANIDLTREYHHRRRARKRGAYGSHTAQQVKTLLGKQRGKCPYCKKNIRKGYHIDHIIALSRGGQNGISNIQLLCPSCNMSKHTTDPITFSQRKGMLL